MYRGEVGRLEERKRVTVARGGSGRVLLAQAAGTNKRPSDRKRCF